MTEIEYSNLEHKTTECQEYNVTNPDCPKCTEFNRRNEMYRKYGPRYKIERGKFVLQWPGEQD